MINTSYTYRVQNPTVENIKALHDAIALLESVRDEIKDKAANRIYLVDHFQNVIDILNGGEF